MNPRLQRLGARPGLTFALVAGTFTLLYVLVRPVEELAGFFVGDRTFLFAPLLVVVSSLSAFLVGSRLWRRAIPERSAVPRWRPVVFGALVGLLSMPVTMYVLTVSRYLFVGVPDHVVVGSPPPGVTSWIPIEKLLLQDISIALFTSVFGFMFTAGLPILIGAVTGEALRRLTTEEEAESRSTVT